MNPLSLIPPQYQLLAKIISGVVVAAACWFLWHEFTGHYIDIGKAERQPEIEALNTNVKTLQDAYADLGKKATECSNSVEALAAESEKKIAAGIAARAEAEKRASGLQQQAAWLSEQLSKPDAKGKTCSDALKEWRAQP